MKFKKLFSRDNKFKGFKEKKWNKLLDKDGFYIIMFLCVCIVGVSAVWVAKSNIDRLATEDIERDNQIGMKDSEIADISENEMRDQIDDIIIIGDEESQEAINEDPTEEDQIVSDDEEDANQPKGKTLVEQEQPQPQIVPTVVTSDDIPVSNPVDEEAIIASSDNVQAMIWPVEGEMGMGYAVETLAYSKTLEHYTTHHGIDIMAEQNTPVKAALAGEVIEVISDSRLGITITLDHGEGLLSRYSNLCTDAMVKIGDKVNQGQTISGVGKSAMFESAENPHLHFEVLKNGENKNPIDYLVEQ